jgi:plastocyanin
MSLNFPANPNLNDVYTDGNTSWKYDGNAWNVVGNDTVRNIFTIFSADTGSASPTVLNDTLRIQGGSNVTTAISGKILTINSTGGGLTQNVFDTISSDDGTTTASSINDTLNILGGTHISTNIATDTDNLVINLDSFPIGFLSNVASTAPTAGQVLKWDGSQWAPGTDVAEGGAGLDADTLDGFDGAYYLNYNNFTNTPDVATLTDFSIGNERTPSGNGAIEYDNTTGVFRYTPPTAAGIGALTAEVNDLTSAVVWANIPDANVPESAVTQHESAITITESQISDLGSYITGIGSFSINALNDVDTQTVAPSNGQVLAWNTASSNWIPSTAGGGETNQNAFSNIAVSGQSTVEADAATDTLTIVAGTGISITTDAGSDSITITNNAATPNFQNLGQVTTASLTVDKIYEPAMMMFRVDNNGTTAYTFNSHYSGNNPTIIVLAGTTVAFDLDAIGGHPFEIQDGTAAPYNTGLVHVATNGTVSTGASAQGKDSGTLYWRIQESISGGYRYQCQFHVAMVGAITVKRLSVI